MKKVRGLRLGIILLDPRNCQIKSQLLQIKSKRLSD
jgi:hypothetical protein